MAFAEDITVFFPPGDPGVFAAIVNAVTVYGDLVNDLDATLDSGTVRHTVPAFVCEFAKLPPVSIGDDVTIGAISYTLRSIEHDYHSPLVTLYLNN